MKIIVHPYNETYVKLEADSSTTAELSDFFSFYVPNYQFSPKFKQKKWDGKIRLYNRRTCLLYKGLLYHLNIFAEQNGYTVEEDSPPKIRLSTENIQQYLSWLNLPDGFDERDYQINAFKACVENERALILSPTSSGKSLIIYMLTQFYQKKTLIIVPRSALLLQLSGDFKEYGYKKDMLLIDQHTDKRWQTQIDETITFSTWQSISDMPADWYNQFEVVIGDEAHHFKADSLKHIMTSATKARFRFALTGSLNDSLTHKSMIEALFGATHQFVTTKELIDRGDIAPLNIHIVLFNHTTSPSAFKKYNEEIDYLIQHEERNKFITDFARKMDGNVLILYTRVGGHGKKLYDSLDDYKGKKFFVHGGTPAEQRDSIRHICERETNAIIVASYGTFSTGINIKNLPFVIFASSHKNRIPILQSIGRILRKHADKKAATVVDLADDLRKSPASKPNYTLKHLYERINLYNEQQFDYEVTKIDL